MGELPLTPPELNPAPGPSDILQMLGLSNTERRAYELLLRTGASTPTVVARETGQSRGRIYETLRLLVEKGLAFEAAGRPIRYSPVTLPEALGLTLEETVRRSELLRDAFQKLVATNNMRDASRFKADPMPVTVLNGRHAFLAEMTRLLAHAKVFYVVNGTEQMAARILNCPELLLEIRKGRERGLFIQFRIPRGDHYVEPHDRLLEEAGPNAVVDVPASQVSPVVTVASENALLVGVGRPDDSSALQGDDAALRIEDVTVRDAVRAQLGTLRPSLPAAPSLQADGLRLLETQFLDSLSEARTEILILAPRGWTRLLEQSWGPLLSAYAAAKARGVRFRALAEDVPEERAILEKFSPIWDLRTTWWVPGWLTVVDRKALFEVTPSNGAQAAPPRMRRSADGQEIRYYVGIFERLWAQGRTLRIATAQL